MSKKNKKMDPHRGSCCYTTIPPLSLFSCCPSLFCKPLASWKISNYSSHTSVNVQKSKLSLKHNEPVGPVWPVTATDGNCYQALYAQPQSPPPPCRCANNPHLYPPIYLMSLSSSGLPLHATLLLVIHSFTLMPLGWTE